MTLRIAIKKHRQDVAKLADGLITQVISPTLWGVDSPYQVFIDGSARPEGTRGGLMSDAGEEKLLNRMEWAITTFAPGWTEEKAKEWWKDRIERRHDGLEEEDGERGGRRRRRWRSRRRARSSKDRRRRRREKRGCRSGAGDSGGPTDPTGRIARAITGEPRRLTR